MSTRITLAVVAIPALALIAGCASMDGLAPAFVDARCERACRATVVARCARCGRRPGPPPTGGRCSTIRSSTADEEALPAARRSKSPRRGRARRWRLPTVAKAALYPQINGNLAITEQRFAEHGSTRHRTPGRGTRSTSSGDSELGTRFLGQEPLRVRKRARPGARGGSRCLRCAPRAVGQHRTDVRAVAARVPAARRRRNSR